MLFLGRQNHYFIVFYFEVSVWMTSALIDYFRLRLYVLRYSRLLLFLWISYLILSNVLVSIFLWARIFRGGFETCFQVEPFSRAIESFRIVYSTNL